jgi:titin
VIQGGATANLVGGGTGPVGGPGNTIDGSIEGVLLAQSGTSQNVVQANRIGLNARATAALGNTVGVVIGVGATSNSIGNTALGGGNFISGNTYAVVISDSGTSGNVVDDDTIGAATAGAAPPGNAVGVVIAFGATANTVGGTQGLTLSGTGNGNFITGNGYGVILAGTGTTQNVVESNFIGADQANTPGIGNTCAGVVIETGATANTVGGTSAVAANVISDNGYGVVLSDTGTSKNVVEGNFLGTDANGTARLGNLLGVLLENGAGGNTVGGTAGGAGNTIAFNAGDGIVLFGNSTVGDSLLTNSIFGNGGLGIDLGADGPTANGPNPRPFPNDGQNQPIDPFSNGGNTVSVRLFSTPNTTFLIQYFGSPAGQPDEGQTFLGSDTVTTNGDGLASFTSALTTALPSGDMVTATATNLTTGDTSEFSYSVQNTTAPAL